MRSGISHSPDRRLKTTPGASKNSKVNCEMTLGGDLSSLIEILAQHAEDDSHISQHFEQSDRSTESRICETLTKSCASGRENENAAMFN
jgi:hypothetical protein